MVETITRRAAALFMAAFFAGAAVRHAVAQDTHTGGAGGPGGSGGAHLPGESHDPGSHTDTSHEDGGHTDTTHEEGGPTGHDPGATEGHEDGKRGPRYRGGGKTTHILGRGYGRSLEDRVLKGH